MIEARPADMKWLLLSGSGRIGRRVFMLGLLFWLAIDCFLISAIATHHADGGELPPWAALAGAGFALSIYSTVKLAAKRVHDFGLPAIAALALFIPAISLILLFLLCVWPSSRGANAYGSASNLPQT